MKNIVKTLLLTIISFIFIGMVNAAEVDLIQNVATIASDVSTSGQSIIPKQGVSNDFVYKYKIVRIDSNDFNAYAKQRYIMDNSTEGTTTYINAATEALRLENKFKENISVVNSASDLESWKTATNGVINPTEYGVVNTSGTHTGYVLAVAATKTGDNNIYVSRVIKESVNATTLGDLKYLDSDKSTIDNSTTTPVDTQTQENPETAVSDVALFITPIAIILGSGMLLRRKRYA